MDQYASNPINKNMNKLIIPLKLSKIGKKNVESKFPVNIFLLFSIALILLFY